MSIGLNLSSFHFQHCANAGGQCWLSTDRQHWHSTEHSYHPNVFSVLRQHWGQVLRQRCQFWRSAAPVVIFPLGNLQIIILSEKY